MRTTIRLDEDLLRQLKKLARRRRVPAGEAVRLRTFRGKGVQPGVDLDDSASLSDLLG
jgi:predicted transcriptional regulator